MKGLYNKDINSSYFLGRKIAFLQGDSCGLENGSSQTLIVIDWKRDNWLETWEYF